MTYTKQDVNRWLTQLGFNPLPRLPRSHARAVYIDRPRPYASTYRIDRVDGDKYTITNLAEEQAAQYESMKSEFVDSVHLAMMRDIECRSLLTEKCERFQVRMACGHIEIRVMRPATAGIAWSQDAIVDNTKGAECKACRNAKGQS